MSAGSDSVWPDQRLAVEPVALETALRGVTQAARQVITGVDHASITIVGPSGELSTAAPTSAVATRAERLQYRHHEGPCVEAVTIGKDVISDQIATDTRWPRYGACAKELGIAAQASLPLQNEGRIWGALNLYSLTAGTFDDVSLETAELLTSSAAVLLGLTRKVNTLSEALASRTTIGMAIGAVMRQFGIDQTRAFDFLVRRSQNANVKLRQVAHDIVEEVGRTGGFHG